MGKISIYNSLTKEQSDAVIKYYTNHTVADTIKNFNLPRSGFNEFLAKHGITLHTHSLSETLKHIAKDGYDKYTTEKDLEIVNYFKKAKSFLATCDFYDIKEYFLVYLLEIYQVPFEKDLTNTQKRRLELQDIRNNISDDEVISYYLAPHTVAETVENFKITADDVNSILARNSVQKRSRDASNKIGAVKRDKAVFAKYGVKNVFQSELIKEKARNTKLAKYGDMNFTNPEKRTVTCLQKYGVKSFLDSEQGQEAIRDYNRKKFGVDYAFLSSEWQNDPSIREKRNKTFLDNKYASFSELYLKLSNNIELLKEFVTNKDIFQISQELAISRNQAYYLLYKNNLLDDYKKQYLGTSHFEQEIIDFLNVDNIIRNDRTILDGKEIDIYLPDKKLGIEFNGTHWHSTEIQFDQQYHLKKSKLAESKGIRLIHIYEYEWEDPNMREKIKLMLNIALGKVSTRIYARKCNIRKISNAEARTLNDKIHLQGHRNAQVTYGLFYNNELVQLMSFSRTKYNRNLTDDNSWEIIRGCPGSNNIVVGGVSRLLKHFIADYHPSKIFSYCDFNKFNGKSYELAGMEFIGYSGPDMKWVLADGRVVNRQPKKHKELKDKAVAQIFGAGSKKYQLVLN